MNTVKDSTGRDYSLVVLKVLDHDTKGRPSTCIIGYDDSTFNIEGGEEFLTAFIPSFTTIADSKKVPV